MVVLILGAKSDVAQAFAYESAAKGDTLILALRNTEDLIPLKKDIELRFKTSVHLQEFDACDFESHQGFYNGLPAKPDMVLCAFGYLGNQDTASHDFKESLKIMQVNYVGAVSILNVVANDFEARRSGVIIGISSVAGERGRKSNYTYGSAKAGFSAYLSGLRNRLFASNVHVLSVKPGFINTKMTKDLPLPAPVTAQPAEVARHIYKAAINRQDVIYSKKIWRYIMFIIKAIPESIFKKMKL